MHVAPPAPPGRQEWPHNGQDEGKVEEKNALDALRRHGGVAQSRQLTSEGMRPAALLDLWRRNTPPSFRRHSPSRAA
jgi:hypothetical protein